ncbi:MAG: 6-phosphogluconate dehydrogenase [Bacteroidota bacterium]
MSTFSDKAASAKSGAKKFFRRLLLIVVVLFIAVMLFFYYGVYSTGVRAGIVLKVSNKGAVFKTHEGQLDLLSFGAVKSENQLSQTFDFSIYKDDTELIKELEEVALSGERVRLRYEEKYISLPWRGDTKYFVTEVERSDNPNIPDKSESDFPQ